jgi:hypothetical protein
MICLRTTYIDSIVVLGSSDVQKKKQEFVEKIKMKYSTKNNQGIHWYQHELMVQFALPPAMSVGLLFYQVGAETNKQHITEIATMLQAQWLRFIMHVEQEEHSVIFLRTYHYLHLHTVSRQREIHMFHPG